MTSIDWNKIQREKELHRAASAALPFDEKLRILDRLRERDESFRTFRERSADVSGHESRPSVQSRDAQSSHGTIRITAFGANATLVATAAPITVKLFGRTGPQR